MNTKEQNNCYTIIGNGRVASHMKHYLQSQNILANSWNRKENTKEDLSKKIEKCKVVLILITDSEIESFIQNNPPLKAKKLVHFSGALVTDLAIGLHPLMTFANHFYSIEFYKKIPFISEHGRESFKNIFPQLENPSFEIDPSLKPLYHALCVMSGNFTTLLWNKVFLDFEQNLKIPSQVLLPYLNKIRENLESNLSDENIRNLTALTGPFARKDQKTILANLTSLNNDPYQNIYLAFLRASLPKLGQEIIEKYEASLDLDKNKKSDPSEKNGKESLNQNRFEKTLIKENPFLASDHTKNKNPLNIKPI